MTHPSIGVVDSMGMEFTEIEPRVWPSGNQNLLQYSGAYILPIKRLSTFSDDEFEIFVSEWVQYFLKRQGRYVKVQKIAGSGDKGRDVVAWKDPAGIEDRHCDIFQCKHYKDPLQPNTLWVELGKLCYFSHAKEYPTPDKYYIVSPQGLGPALSTLIGNSEGLRDGLKKHWDTYCKTKITKNSVIELTGELETFVDKFDFAKIDSVDPLDLIQQHQASVPHHWSIFGGQPKERPAPLQPPSEVGTGEARYVDQLYSVYTEKIGKKISNHSDLSSEPKYKRHFNDSRKHFYSAESLKLYARDAMPGNDHFDSLCTEIYDGVSPALAGEHVDSYEKVLKVTDAATKVAIDSSALQPKLKQSDRIGICHHLVNEDKIQWIEEDE